MQSMPFNSMSAQPTHSIQKQLNVAKNMSDGRPSSAYNNMGMGTVNMVSNEVNRSMPNRKRPSTAPSREDKKDSRESSKDRQEMRRPNDYLAFSSSFSDKDRDKLTNLTNKGFNN